MRLPSEVDSLGQMQPQHRYRIWLNDGSALVAAVLEYLNAGTILHLETETEPDLYVPYAAVTAWAPVHR